MLRNTFTGRIYRMGRVAKPEALKHQPIPQKPPYTNKILEISSTLIESGQGISQPQSCTLPYD